MLQEIEDFRGDYWSHNRRKRKMSVFAVICALLDDVSALKDRVAELARMLRETQDRQNNGPLYDMRSKIARVVNMRHLGTVEEEQKLIRMIDEYARACGDARVRQERT